MFDKGKIRHHAKIAQLLQRLLTPHARAYRLPGPQGDPGQGDESEEDSTQDRPQEEGW